MHYVVHVRQTSPHNHTDGVILITDNFRHAIDTAQQITEEPARFGYAENNSTVHARVSKHEDGIVYAARTYLAPDNPGYPLVFSIMRINTSVFAHWEEKDAERQYKVAA